MPTNDKARLVAQWLADKKAVDIVALDVSRVCPIAEAMVVASAMSSRQAKALADHVLAMCAEKGLGYLGMEGYRQGQWVLVDLNDVLVHVFLEETRTFYNIEGLWSEGARLDVPTGSRPEKDD